MWLLIAVIYGHSIAFQPFKTQAECEAIRAWIKETAAYSGSTSAVCYEAINPYIR